MSKTIRASVTVNLNSNSKKPNLFFKWRGTEIINYHQKIKTWSITPWQGKL